MSSRVLKRVVFVAKDGSICSCEGNFYKTCPRRVRDNVLCRESIIRITPIERQPKPLEDEGLIKIIRTIDKAFDKIENKFKNTLKHLSTFDRYKI